MLFALTVFYQPKTSQDPLTLILCISNVLKEQTYEQTLIYDYAVPRFLSLLEYCGHRLLANWTMGTDFVE